ERARRGGRGLVESKLFGQIFAAPSFWTWRVVGKLIDGIPLTEQREIDLFRECTGRTKLPTKPARRVFVLAGRRAGKDRFESAVAVWRSALCTRCSVSGMPSISLPTTRHVQETRRRKNLTK